MLPVTGYAFGQSRYRCKTVSSDGQLGKDFKMVEVIMARGDAPEGVVKLA